MADFLSCENTRRDEVATKTTGSGRTDNPRTIAGDTVIRIIQNAFFRVILPGFGRELAHIRRA